MEISIVSGTYNRINHLQRMVQSVRYSVGVGIPYEIVLVDGGSTDGTIEWCKSQSDIVLIEHGRLLGAVRAFNDGARASRGTYVVLANDDIEFVDESIMSAFSFMQDNANVGVGCFYQDRRGWNWHIEQMPAVLNGKQISANYGQVCIVPKWLGDKVGWWGDYLRTYGGDNELSCNVLELGYKIEPIPCACIHDTTPMDRLRNINNQYDPKKGNHPDTQGWLDKWTRNGKVGPVISNVIKVPNPIQKKMRILYAPIYERGYSIQKRTKRGLRDAFSKIGVVQECDYVERSPDYVYDVANAFRPDIIVLQVHSVGEWTAENVQELRDDYPKSIIVNWNGDYHPEHLYDYAYIQMLKRFHLTGVVTTSVEEEYNRNGVKWFYWQIGWEEADNEPTRKTPRHDVLFIGNGYSGKRLELGQYLSGLPYNVGLYGIWPRTIKSHGTNLYDFDAGAKLYKAAKISIGDSQWPNAKGFVSNRLFQSLAAGAFLLHQYFEGMEELLGLRDGEHLVVWTSLDDLRDKIDFYLKNDRERNRIASNGQKFVIENHSFDHRVKELFSALKI